MVENTQNGKIIPFRMGRHILMQKGYTKLLAFLDTVELPNMVDVPVETWSKADKNQLERCVHAFEEIVGDSRKEDGMRCDMVVLLGQFYDTAPFLLGDGTQDMFRRVFMFVGESTVKQVCREMLGRLSGVKIAELKQKICNGGPGFFFVYGKGQQNLGERTG